MSVDMSKLTPAPLEIVHQAWQPTQVFNNDRTVGLIITGDRQKGEVLADFILLARNAFDGDPEALAWWEANRKKR